MKFFPLILKVIGGLVAIVVVAIVVIVTIVDPNDYRDKITEVVKKETGRDLQIQSLSLSFFPTLGLNLENTTLSNAKGFSEQVFLHADKVQVGAAILPLLSQQLEVDTLTLHGLKLNLEKNAEGISNWDDLVKPSTEAKVDEPPAEKANPLEKLANLNFGGIDIQNGQIHWNDQQASQTVDLTINNLSTDAIAFGEFFTITLSAESNLAKPEMKALLDLTIEAKLDKDGSYAVRNLMMKSTAEGAGIPIDKASVELTIPTIDLAMASNQLNLPDLTLTYDVIGGKEFPMQTITGQLQLDALSGDLSSQQFQAKQLTLNTDATGESLPGGKLNATASMQPSVDLTAQTAEITQLSLTAMEINATGSVKATQITSDALVDAQLNIAQTNLRALLTQLKIALPEMADNKTLTKFAAAMNIHFNAKTQAVSVNGLNVTLDESQLTGKASVSQFDRPDIRYDLALNKIDLNRYLPTKKAEPEPKKDTTPAEDAEIELPTELLRKLTLNGTVKVASVTFDKLNPKNILVTVKGSNGKINANPIRADIFKTQINAETGLDVSGETQKFSFKTDSKNIPIGDVLVAVADTDKLSGTGSVNANITTAGSRISQFKQNLNGTAAVDLVDGSIKGFNLAQSIREAQAKMSGKPAPENKEELQTDFSSLVMEATIKQGVVTTQKLLAQAPFMRISGSGSVNLPKESLNYLVNTKIVGSDKGQGGEDLKELNGLTLPVRLKGNYTSPNVSLDLASLVEEKAKMELDKKKEEVVEETKKKVEEQLKDTLLKGFKF